MTNDQFCYWLQGYFELRAGSTDLNTVQIKCILSHIDMTETHMEKLGGLGGTILAIRAILKNAPSTPAAVIESLLHDVFERVIDPKAGTPEHQAKLDAAHSGGHGRPPLISC